MFAEYRVLGTEYSGPFLRSPSTVYRVLATDSGEAVSEATFPPMPPHANSPRAADFVCPNCGADVPAKALACPECGADETAGWNETGYAGQGSADPEDSFDYREAFDREFGDVVKPEGIKPIWWFTGIVIVVVFALGALRSMF